MRKRNNPPLRPAVSNCPPDPLPSCTNQRQVEKCEGFGKKVEEDGTGGYGYCRLLEATTYHVT